jgi:endonuclease III related protein
MKLKPPQSASPNTKRHSPSYTDLRSLLPAFYDTLFTAYGPQHWWPASSRFEMIVGAYLTQNTAWTNVELAFANLRRARVLSLSGIRKTPLSELEQHIRPAGYFRQKAARLKIFVAHLDNNYDGSLTKMFSRPTAEVRAELLSLNGVGPETADSILLYAGQHEIFVVDAYTRRIFERHRLTRPTTTYDDIRASVEQGLSMKHSANSIIRSDLPVPPIHAPSPLSETPRSPLAQRCNEFHALLVQVGKHLCQSREAKCHLCPLAVFLPPSGPKLIAKKKKPRTRGKHSDQPL